MFRKVLVANRGEIAVRIIRALRELNIPSVAVYSDADRGALHVRMADEAEHIGPAPSSESYLNAGRIIEAAAKHHADAIHPGYGFLSENSHFAAACASAGITFVGPSARSIELMGSKTQARMLAREAGVPVVPGTLGEINDTAAAAETARRIGYPIMIKAAAGGGGKGMRLVRSEAGLDSALRDASSEAERAFRDGEVYIEKFIEFPRHIEIQVFGDHNGRIIHLGERECSVQRRHQKVIEECPSPLLTGHPDLRCRMGEAAVLAAKAAGYSNAGTVEFLVDRDLNFYFLEMNTRLQVEHPVTELVTGLDLVHWQLRIAAGESLPLLQEEISWSGAALECRIYAEDPDQDFLPSPGLITHLQLPSGPGVRLDSGIYPRWRVPMEYDPLLAKLVVSAATRDLAINRMLRALDEFTVGGIRTNLSFFRQILRDPCFREGALHTGFIEDFFRRRAEPERAGKDLETAAVLAAFLHSQQKQPPRTSGSSKKSRWLSDGRSGLLR
ncbi:MAG: acetyl-CoA carboxylase biotin carboxylase subunit [Bryobacteraceae bacterium]